MSTRGLDKCVVEMVAAYVSFNELPKSQLPGLIQIVRDCCAHLGRERKAPQRPVVAVPKSVRADHIICLEDGMKLKSLTRHLRAAHGMTPYDYRKKWGLPKDYPMTTANSAKLRSDAARRIGLGYYRRKHPK